MFVSDKREKEKPHLIRSGIWSSNRPSIIDVLYIIMLPSITVLLHGISLSYVILHYTAANGSSLHFDVGPSVAPGSLTADAASIASSIKYHAEFTPLFSPQQFDLLKAFFATAQSVRDALILNWNATYDYYEKMNVKQANYLSLEFLQVWDGSCLLFIASCKLFLILLCMQDIAISMCCIFCRVGPC